MSRTDMFLMLLLCQDEEDDEADPTRKLFKMSHPLPLALLEMAEDFARRTGVLCRGNSRDGWPRGVSQEDDSWILALAAMKAAEDAASIAAAKEATAQSKEISGKQEPPQSGKPEPPQIKVCTMTYTEYCRLFHGQDEKDNDLEESDEEEPKEEEEHGPGDDKEDEAASGLLRAHLPPPAKVHIGDTVGYYDADSECWTPAVVLEEVQSSMASCFMSKRGNEVYIVKLMCGPHACDKTVFATSSELSHERCPPVQWITVKGQEHIRTPCEEYDQTMWSNVSIYSGDLNQPGSKKARA